MPEYTPPAWVAARAAAMRPPVRLNPGTTALVVIDMQNFFLDPATPIAVPRGHALAGPVNDLVAGLRAAGCLIVWVQQGYGEEELARDRSRPVDPGTAFRAALGIDQPGFGLSSRLKVDADDLRVVKRTPSALHPRSDCALLDCLYDRGIETVVIAGIETNVCCDTTARDAAQHGFRVCIASDATAAMTEAEHEAALLNLALWFADVRSRRQLIDMARQG